MTDLQATLDAIDELAHQECGHCRRPLRADGPSLDFCDDWCQASWLRAKQEIVELVGYREPDDLPVHAFNLVELSSPETTPAPTWPTVGYGGTITFNVTVDLSSMYDAFERAWESMARMASSLAGGPPDDRVRVWSPGWAVFDEIHLWEPRGILNMPTPEAGAVPDRVHEPEPFGADFDFEHRPATTLPDEPPPAVMPALPERDWQALVDARTTSAGPERGRRAPRNLGRRR